MLLVEPAREIPPATLRLRVDTEALADNWRALDRLSGSARAGAAVKADGYGLGIDVVMTTLARAGARDFFVAHWSEVPAVLAHVPASAISVLHGPLNAAEANFARATGVRPVINSLHQARLWTEGGGGPCHLMVDTGINRLGVPPHQLGDPILAGLESELLMSHLASADEDSTQNARQLDLFRAAMAQHRAREYSLANSAGVALGRDFAFDLTRPGLALYGGIPRGELAHAIRPVVLLEAAVLQVRELNEGDTVGYGATFRAPQRMRSATVSIGYGDGFLRSWSSAGAGVVGAGGGSLRFCGCELPLIGRVSMDSVVVDASAAPQLGPGDFVQIPYSLPQASDVSGLSQYELLTLLGDRFARG